MKKNFYQDGQAIYDDDKRRHFLKREGFEVKEVLESKHGLLVSATKNEETPRYVYITENKIISERMDKEYAAIFNGSEKFFFSRQQRGKYCYFIFEHRFTKIEVQNLVNKYETVDHPPKLTKGTDQPVPQNAGLRENIFLANWKTVGLALGLISIFAISSQVDTSKIDKSIMPISEITPQLEVSKEVKPISEITPQLEVSKEVEPTDNQKLGTEKALIGTRQTQPEQNKDVATDIKPKTIKSIEQILENHAEKNGYDSIIKQTENESNKMFIPRVILPGVESAQLQSLPSINKTDHLLAFASKQGNCRLFLKAQSKKFIELTVKAGESLLVLPFGLISGVLPDITKYNYSYWVERSLCSNVKEIAHIRKLNVDANSPNTMILRVELEDPLKDASIGFSWKMF